MNILFLSHASLASGFVVGSHQLARQYKLKGHSVLHASSPVSILNLLKGKGGIRKIYQSLFPSEINTHWGFVDIIPFVPFPYGYVRLLDKINDYFIKKCIVNNGGDRFDLVLIDQPLFSGLISKLDFVNVVYRPTDVYSDMGGGRFKIAENQILNQTYTIIATNNILLITLTEIRVK